VLLFRLRSRVHSGRALVAGALGRDGNRTVLKVAQVWPVVGGRGGMLSHPWNGQVFMRVPEHLNCRNITRKCEAGLRPVYKRNVDRCRVFVKCAAPVR
jgi:hypothetical protein